MLFLRGRYNCLALLASERIKIGIGSIFCPDGKSISKMGKAFFPFLVGFDPISVRDNPISVIFLPKYGRYFPISVIQIAQTPCKIRGLQAFKNIKRKNI